MSNEFDKPKAVKTKANSNRNQPALINQIRDNALSILTNQLDQLFSACDDLFFDLSSRAISNSEQNLYFESMRELRVKKTGVLDSFRHKVEQLFLDSAHKSDVAESAAEPQKSESLSLVQEDEIEQRVAIDGMIGKARGRNQEALYHLAVRLDYLTSGNTITEKNNPIDPRQLCQGFASACDLLNISIKAKIIIYKQFDRLAISGLPKLYANANDLLVNAGIIPNISHSANKKDNDTMPATQSDQALTSTTKVLSNQVFSGESNFDFSALSQLLQTMQHLGPSLIPNYQPYSANPGPMMSNEELLATLSLLQTQLQAEQLGSVPAVDDSNVRDIVDSILKESDPEIPQAVKKTEEDTINLVAMFFDFILDDRNLPVVFQALLGRLQIPILKTALRDQSFFSNSQHPARALVNELASASIGWGSDEVRDTDTAIHEDKTYQFIAKLIQDIAESSADNDQIYEEKFEELQGFMSRNNHRNSLIEKRTHQAAEGQAKNKLARAAAKETLFALMERSQLPEAISEFLIEPWQQYMTITHLKHGEQSAEWLDAVQLAQDIIWVCLPQRDEKSEVRYAKIFVELFNRIASGLKQVIHTDEEISTLTDEVKRTVEDIQRQYHGSSSVSEDLKPLSIDQAKALGHEPGSGSKSWKEMTALERQKARYQSLTYEFIKKVESLPLNTWLTYLNNTEGQTIRCKLAGKIEASDSFIFVDRFGFNVLEKTRKEFAYDLQQERVTLLDSGLLFDRAMSSIANNLRQLTSRSSDSNDNTAPEAS